MAHICSHPLSAQTGSFSSTAQEPAPMILLRRLKTEMQRDGCWPVSIGNVFDATHVPFRSRVSLFRGFWGVAV